MACARQTAIWEMIKEREAGGGKAWDQKLLDNARASSPPSPKRRNRPHRSNGSKNGGDVLADTPSTNHSSNRDELINRLMDESQSSTDPTSAAPGFSMLGHRGKPQPPVRTRQKILPSYTARYLPGYVVPDAETLDISDDLAAKCGFTPEKVKTLYSEFLRFAKASKSKQGSQDPLLNLRGFMRLLDNQGVVVTSLVQRLFEVNLVRNQHEVNFSTYLKMLSVFKTQCRRQQAKFVFKLCDSNCDRKLNSLELLRLVTDGVPKGKRVLVNAILDEMLSLLGAGSSEDVGYEQFINAVEHNEGVWELFQALSPFTRIQQMFPIKVQD